MRFASLSPLALVAVDTAVVVVTMLVAVVPISVFDAGIEAAPVVALGVGADSRALASASRSLCSSHDSSRTRVLLSSAAVTARRVTTGPGQA